LSSIVFPERGDHLVALALLLIDDRQAEQQIIPSGESSKPLMSASAASDIPVYPYTYEQDTDRVRVSGLFDYRLLQSGTASAVLLVRA